MCSGFTRKECVYPRGFSPPPVHDRSQPAPHSRNRPRSVTIELLKFLLPLLLLTTALAADAVERWGIYEIALQGPATGNPFVDIQLEAHFRFQNRVVAAAGFYDGDGAYRIRFMPDETGPWTYTTS